jgi:hypothetical protein
VDEPRGLTCLADTADEQGHIGALPAAVRVQLVEDQKAQPARVAHELVLAAAREDELEHHVVREQDVGRVREDLPPSVARGHARPRR